MLLLLAIHLATSRALPAQAVEVSGWFSSIWVDPISRTEPSRIAHYVTTTAGEMISVDVPAELITRAGGESGLRGRMVRLSGIATSQQPVTRLGGPLPRRMLRATQIQLLDAALPGNVTQGVRAQRAPSAYVTLLCKLADSVNLEPRTKAQYEEMILGSKYPDVSHYWPNVTDAYVATSGSRVYGWYVLPHPKSYYFGTRPDGSLDLSDTGERTDLLKDDCMTAADADVDFSQFTGVNLQFNEWWEIALGGGGVITKDGPARFVGMTWMPSWATPFVYAHETGHSFGLPHSATPYDNSYGGFFDVMSQGRFWDTSLPDEVPSGTIAYHQQRLGNLTDDDVLVPAPGTRITLNLDVINTPSRAGTSSRMVTLPLGGTRFYTLEARHKSGPYEKWIPASGVLLFDVDTVATPGRDWVPARIVDADHNGNPNDAGAVWTQGETWTDSVNGYSFTILGETATGYSVSVRRGFATTVTVRGPGSVSTTSATCAQSPCEFLVANGNALTIQATPTPGEQFLGWAGACTGTIPSCVLTPARDESLTAKFGRPIVIADVPRKSGVVGQAFYDTLSASGGVDGISWQITSGTLPPGLTLNSKTGVVSGTATAAGVSNLALRASSDELSATTSLSIEIETPLVVTSAAARPVSIVGVAYADTLRSAGGSVSQAHWHVGTGSLPPGVALSDDGLVTGAPTTAGDYQASIVVESTAQHIEQSFAWHVARALQITSVAARPAGIMGANYHDTLRVAGDLPVHWVVTGSLPPGLTIDTTTGIVSGVPERTGDFAFSARADLRSPNSGPLQTESNLSITVTAPSVTPSAVIDQLLNKKPLSADVLRYFDLLGNRNGRLDVGDIAAWLEVTGQVGSPSASALSNLLAPRPRELR